ncbi:phage terminase large subunit [Sphingobacterium spiritivorum]|uniref:phage terminase large subunit n=1 Tax=Sphingobacterium spiritivorum TaxID=258 RepID=UPI003DA47FB8
MTSVAGFTKRDIIALWCKSSILNYTKYFFQKQYSRSFVVGDHHVKIAKALDDVLMGRITRLIINIAPRYGKTELAVKNLISAGLAINPASKFIHLSYSDDLALDNSEAVKDLVQSEAYQQLFPDVELKQGSGAKNKWYTTQGGGVYARAAGGQVTGFGAGQVDTETSADQLQDEELDLDEMLAMGGDIFGGALIIDDPIKPDDADSEIKRERVNNRFDSTIINRVNSRNTPIIIIMQRLHENDLCGHVLANYPGEWTVLSLPSIIVEDGQDLKEGRALWGFKHTLDELLKMNDINPINFGRQYMQNPQPKEGLMYRAFKEYINIPPYFKAYRKAYVDTADTGKDYLCSIAYLETDLGCFVLDVIYTQDPMEITEPDTARQLAMHQVEYALIESNNGGRGFARNVESHLVTLKAFNCTIEWFHQGENKHARIFTNSAKVNMIIHMPVGWDKMWPQFYKHVTTYSKKGNNAHDDALDALTGVVENFGVNKESNIDDSVIGMFG